MRAAGLSIDFDVLPVVSGKSSSPQQVMLKEGTEDKCEATQYD